jgi:hypothetical protein
MREVGSWMVTLVPFAMAFLLFSVNFDKKAFLSRGVPAFPDDLFASSSVATFCCFFTALKRTTAPRVAIFRSLDSNSKLGDARNAREISQFYRSLSGR